MKHGRRLALVAMLLISALALTGCMSGDDGDGTAAPATTTMETHEGMAEDATGDGEASNAADGNGISSPASDLRITLDRLLGEHALLAMFATQKGLMGEKDFKPIAGALDANSVDLADAIGSVYGPEARKEFLNGKLKWRPHIGFFVDYTVGLAKKDKAMQQKAVGNLKGYIESFSSFLADATELPQPALRGAINEHVGHLKGQIDAYAAGDYAKAYSLTRTGYEHMYMTGDALAGAIVKQSPEKFAA